MMRRTILIGLSVVLALQVAFSLRLHGGEDLKGSQVEALEGRTEQDGAVNKDEAKRFVADEVKKEGTPPYRVIRLRKKLTPPPPFKFDPFREEEKYRRRIQEALRVRTDPHDGMQWYFWTHEPAYVDIWFDPEEALVFGDVPTMFESTAEIEGPSLIRVSAVLADSQKAAKFPLRCDGNLVPPGGPGVGEPKEYHWSAIVAGAIDLDVDTDNTNGVFGGPDRDLVKEDRWEAAESDQDPGKYMPRNDGDTDDDQIPGFADGFGAFGPESQTSAGTRFVKAILDVSNVEEIINWNKARVRFKYSASDPNPNPKGLRKEGSNNKEYHIPADGLLRIWTKDGGEKRNPAPVPANGDWVPGGDENGPSEFLANKLFKGKTIVTLYLEGIQHGGNGGLIEVEFDPLGEGPWMPDEVRVSTFSIRIDDIELPNDFVALPDQVTQDRIQGDIEQDTSTEMRITYSILPDGFAFDKVLLEVSDGEHSKEYELDKTTGTGIQEVVTIELDEDWMVDNDKSRLDIRLKGTKESAECIDRADVAGKRLLYDLEYSPKAYREAQAVCPYTHKHQPIKGSNPDHIWYGLKTEYELQVDLDDITASVTGGDAGNKALPVMAEAKTVAGLHVIKWEGYDATIGEPASLPYCVFPEPIAKQPAPEHVVKEGNYSSKIVAKDTEKKLKQRHEIAKIKVCVRYDMTNASR